MAASSVSVTDVETNKSGARKWFGSLRLQWLEACSWEPGTDVGEYHTKIGFDKLSVFKPRIHTGQTPARLIKAPFRTQQQRTRPGQTIPYHTVPHRS